MAVASENFSSFQRG